MTGGGDNAAYLRAKLRTAGIDDDTDLPDLCDAIVFVLAEGVPGEQLEKLRRSIDRAAWRIKPPDRDSWGLRADQAAQMGRLASGPA